MIRLWAGAFCILLLCAAPLTRVEAGICKTVKGEWVGFGEDGARKEAESRLEQAIAAWRERYNLAAVKPKSRKVGCNIYIQALNEYFCTAEATVCR